MFLAGLALTNAIDISALEFVSLEEAYAIQKKSGKIIMIDAVRKDCRYCIKMDKEVLDNQEMQQWLLKRFIPVKIDIDEQIVPCGLKVHFTPTFVFLKNNEVIKVIPGSWNIVDFKELTRDIK